MKKIYSPVFEKYRYFINFCMVATLKNGPIKEKKKVVWRYSPKTRRYQISSKSVQWFPRSSWAHTDRQTDRPTDRHPDGIPKTTFSDSWGVKTCKSIKISRSNFLAITILPLAYYVVRRESKKSRSGGAFGVADSEYEASFLKNKMVDPIWRQSFAKLLVQ